MYLLGIFLLKWKNIVTESTINWLIAFEHIKYVTFPDSGKLGYAVVNTLKYIKVFYNGMRKELNE